MTQRRRPAAATALVLALTLVALPARPQGADGLIQTTDLLEIRQLHSVTLSPDGRWVVYGVTAIEKEEEPEKNHQDREPEEKRKKQAGPKYVYRGQLFLVPLDGSAPPRQLTRGEASSSQPAWSPDGRRLAFVREAQGEPQIWVLPLDGGEAWQLTRLETGAGDPRWSPDGGRILFRSEVAITEGRLPPEGGAIPTPPWPYERPGRRVGDVADWRDEDGEKPAADPDGSLQEIREWLAKNAARDNPRVFIRLDLQGETDLDPEVTASRLLVVEAREGAEPRTLTPGFSSYFQARWTPDGQGIVAAGVREPATHPDRLLDSDLFVIAADGSEVRTLLDLPGHQVLDPMPAPDGRTVAFVASEVAEPNYGQDPIGVVPLAGGEARLLTAELDRSAGRPAWSPDGRFLYFVAPADGGFPLYRVPAAGGAVERLTDPARGVRSFDVGAAGLAYVLTEVANPFELHAAGLDAASPRALTRHNAAWLEGRRLSLPEARQLRRPDGLTVDYWLMKPTAFEAGRTYPLLLQIHGGPSAMWGPGEATMWHEFQLFAARGYGVVYSNPRGSGGYGRAFQRANHQDWGHGPGGDVLAVASEAARESWVDPDRQVVTGGSYAGYLTAWIVGHDHRFKAAVAQRGVYDLTTFFGEGNAWRLVPWAFGGHPWEEDSHRLLRASSPLSHVHQIRTPLLILHGDNDLRTGVSQSEMLYKSLKVLGRPVEYVRYPRAGHDLSRTGDPHQRMDRLLRILEFMARFVGPP